MKQTLQSLMEAGKPLPLRKSSLEIPGNQVAKSQEYSTEQGIILMDTIFCEACGKMGLFRLDDPICVQCGTWYR